MIHYYHIFFIINVLLSDFPTVFYSFVVIFIAFDKKSATLQRQEIKICADNFMQTKRQAHKKKTWRKTKTRWRILCDLFLPSSCFHSSSFSLFVDSKSDGDIFFTRSRRFNIVWVWVCDRYCFECDIFCGCWMNYENECNSPFLSLACQLGIWHIFLSVLFIFRLTF